MSSKCSRGGIRLIDLLVVLAVLGVLIPLLMPAIQAAREAARRTRCTDHLKQLGIALTNYHGMHLVFPPGIVAQNRGPNPADTCQFLAMPLTNRTPGVVPPDAYFSQTSGLTLL